MGMEQRNEQASIHRPVSLPTFKRFLRHMHRFPQHCKAPE